MYLPASLCPSPLGLSQTFWRNSLLFSSKLLSQSRVWHLQIVLPLLIHYFYFSCVLGVYAAYQAEQLRGRVNFKIVRKPAPSVYPEKWHGVQMGRWRDLRTLNSLNCDSTGRCCLSIRYHNIRINK